MCNWRFLSQSVDLLKKLNPDLSRQLLSKVIDSVIILVWQLGRTQKMDPKRVMIIATLNF